jgi:hypothetical protein
MMIQAQADIGTCSLYRRVLGEAWALLPEPLRAMHDNMNVLKAHGTAVVERGTGMLSRLVAKIVGFPDQGTQVPVEVLFEASPRGERWQRTFDGKSFFSFQAEGRKSSEPLVEERFGPFAFDLALIVKEDRLYLMVRRWRVWGIPLPAAWAPGGDTYEFADNGRFCFHVEIAHPLLGLIVRYRGSLVPAV